MDNVSYHPGPADGSLLTRQSEHRSDLIWHGQELPDFRIRSNFKGYWDIVKEHPPLADIYVAIKGSGLHGVYQIGSFRHDAGLITAFVERWRPETHTFHFRFGEATITFEDVHHILGLPTCGVPVIHSYGSSSLHDIYSMVREVLGLDPVEGAVTSAGIKITWLVENFASCERLDIDSEDYETDLVFHIRAHLLLIIGSLFPNSSGNKIQLQLLHYVRDHTQVHTYSWGSAVHSYLYYNLCSASIGYKKEICGAMTLLQIWIWEHFPSLAPARRDDAYIEHPLTVRWNVRLSIISVPRSQSRLVSYELDCMSDETYICWRPYRLLSGDFLPNIAERRLWSAKCPLIFNGIVEWCYTDRVTRQFGMKQDIPTNSPEENHYRLHGTLNDGMDWVFRREPYIELWESRMSQVLSPGRNPQIQKSSCTRDYHPWYQSVTRMFINDPRYWSNQQGFQGTQGHSQYYVDGISQAYHAIRPEHPNVAEARQILRDRMTSTGCSTYRHTLPLQPPSLTAERRGSQRHTTTGRPRGRPRDVPVVPEPGTYYDEVLRGGWDSWTQGTSHYQSQMSRDSWDAGASHGGSQDHSPLTQSQHDYAGGSHGGSQDHSPLTQARHDYAGGSHGGSQDHSPMTQSQHDYAGGSHGNTSQYETPVRGFGEFATHGNPWSSPTSTGIDEDNVPVQQRQQPHRHVKGRGRRCFTGSHIL